MLSAGRTEGRQGVSGWEDNESVCCQREEQKEDRELVGVDNESVCHQWEDSRKTVS